ncbi:MAG: hypothetical protein KDD70_15350, partial [Bdellovibrionales bacterium]|nr:hypothetical protein [Bdellovibrionales bacterium]
MKKLIRSLFGTLLGSGALYALSLQFIERFPETSNIHPALKEAPFQTDTDAKPFLFEYRGTGYYVEPVQDYEISGLVVSHNNISSIADAYHTSSSVDFKDLCVVWGQNAKKDLLDQMTFWSEPWTCWTRADTPNAEGRFFPDELSNNHLLTKDDKIRELINGVRIGDQVQLRGWLVNYAYQASPDFARKSSLVRTDTGNGACETIFVTEAKVLKTANAGWRSLHGVTRASSLFLLVLLPLLWFWDIQVTHKKRRDELAE